MNRDQLNREIRNGAGSWQALAVVYGLIVLTMVLSAAS